MALNGPMIELTDGVVYTQPVDAKLAALTALADTIRRAIDATPDWMTGGRTRLIGELSNVVESVRLLCLPSQPQ